MVVLVVLLLLVAGVYAGGYALTSDKLPQGSKVGSVRVGGLSPAAARQKVGRETAALAARPVTLQVEDRTYRLRPADVGLEVDVAGSVAQVPVGRSFDPRDMWDALVGSTEVPLLTVAVGDDLERRIGRIADQLDEPVVEGDVRYTGGRAVAVYPQVGHLLDRAAAVAAVEAAYPASGTRVKLSLTDAPPAVSSTEVSREMREFANPAVSGPVTYRFGRGVVVVVRPDDFGPALSTTASVAGCGRGSTPTGCGACSPWWTGCYRRPRREHPELPGRGPGPPRGPGRGDPPRRGGSTASSRRYAARRVGGSSRSR